MEAAFKKYEEARTKSKKAAIMLKLFCRSSPLDKRRTKEDNSFLFVDQDNVIRMYEAFGKNKKFTMKGKSKHISL